MLNRGPINAGPINSAGNVELSITYAQLLAGKSSIYNAFGGASQGQHGQIIAHFSGLQSVGSSSVYASFASQSMGGFGLGATVFFGITGGEFRLDNSFGGASVGVAALLNNYTATISRGAYGISAANYTAEFSGAFSVGYSEFTAETRGTAQLNGFVDYSGNIALGVSAQLSSYTAEFSGLMRIANDHLNRFELYIGDNAEPDFNASPTETFSALPHETAPLASGSVYRLALRKRNQYGLVSKNIKSWALDLSSGPDALPDNPSAPQFSIISSSGGAMRVIADYAYMLDGEAAADTFLIYYTTNGIDPDPAIDIPVTVSMSKTDGIARLDYTTSQFSDGTEVRALVRVRRSGAGGADSINSAAQIALSETTGPDRPIGVILFGKIAGQTH